MKCPKCKSEDTTIINANTEHLSMGCDECGHTFKAKTLTENGSKVTPSTIFYVIKFTQVGNTLTDTMARMGIFIVTNRSFLTLNYLTNTTQNTPLKL